MKKKLIAMGLAVVLTLSMSLTAFAASSSTGGNSGNKSESSSSTSTDSTEGSSTSTSAPAPAKKAATVENTAPGGKVDAKTVKVAIVGADGTASAVSLDTVVNTAKSTIIASASTAQNAAATVQALMTKAPTAFFSQTVEALAAAKGSAMVVNNMGTIKTAAKATDAFGNTIASAGVVKNVTSGALIMLMSVNVDGTIEYTEGIVDPVTGAVLGAFQGIPAVITVLVLA